MRLINVRLMTTSSVRLATSNQRVCDSPTCDSPKRFPCRYNVFDRLYEILFTELYVSEGDDVARDDLKGGLHGFLREIVVCRCDDDDDDDGGGGGGSAAAAAAGAVGGNDAADTASRRGLLPLVDWMTEPSFMNSVVIQLIRAQLQEGDL